MLFLPLPNMYIGTYEIYLYISVCMYVISIIFFQKPLLNRTLLPLVKNVISQESVKHSELFNLSSRFNQKRFISLLCIVKCPPQFVSPILD